MEGTVDPLSLQSVGGTELPKERVARGDRDLARYMAILLKPVQDKLTIAFRTPNLVKDAKKAWETAGTGGRLIAFDKGGNAKRAAFGSGSESDDTEAFLRSLQAAGCGVLVAVAPRAKQLRTIAALNNKVSNDFCIILVNARLRGRAESDSLTEELALAFNPAFHLRLCGEPGKEGVVYRAVQEEGAGPWIVARRQLEVIDNGSQEVFVARQISKSLDEPGVAQVKAALASVA